MVVQCSQPGFILILFHLQNLLPQKGSVWRVFVLWDWDGECGSQHRALSYLVSLKARLGVKKYVGDELVSALITIITLHGATVYFPHRWEVETDETVLQRRQKQIDYGKCTPGYQCFLQQVPKWVQLWVVTTAVSSKWLWFNVGWWKDTRIWVFSQSYIITTNSLAL